jgi:hypothetical protein
MWRRIGGNLLFTRIKCQLARAVDKRGRRGRTLRRVCRTAHRNLRTDIPQRRTETSQRLDELSYKSLILFMFLVFKFLNWFNFSKIWTDLEQKMNRPGFADPHGVRRR